MVKSIQVFKYEYAPTKAEIREKLGTKKTIKRPISNLYKDNNVKKLDHLETIIRDLDENHEDGTLGFIDHQYFRKLDLGGDNYTYEDNWEGFFFFISSKYNILIIGGGQERLRNQARNILVQFLSGDISFISIIDVKTSPMLTLVNKIKTQGPKNSNAYKNIMVDLICKYLRTKDHYGSKRDEIHMHITEQDPHCVSKHPHFTKNTSDSDTSDVTLAIYKCNGVLSNESQRAAYLTMYDNARFECSANPDPQHWVIFVLETCKTALNLA